MSQEKKPSVLKRALWNQYNMIMLGGAGLFALATASWLPLVVGVGAEVLWLVIGADTSLFKRWVAKQESKEAQEAMKKRTAEMLAALGPAYIRRFEELSRRADKIQELARANPGLEIALIQSEMDKLGKLLFSFLEMALVHQRFQQYLAENRREDVERDIQQLERAISRESDRGVLEGLRQNLSLTQKRLNQHGKIESGHRLLDVKMDTLEKSFRYLQSHVVGVGNISELSQELNDLVVGVESIEEITQDTDALLQSLGERAEAEAPQPARARR
jgi:hypothetical protein